MTSGRMTTARGGLSMALTARRRGDNGLSAWPGYVDALSTLLMVIIFVLLVFVLAQGFLSVALTGRDKQLDRVNRQLAEVSDMLSLERGRSADLQQSIAALNNELSATTAARASLSQQLTSLRAQAEQTTTDRDALRADRDRLAQQLADTRRQLATSVQQAQAVTTQASALQRQLDDTNGKLDAASKAGQALNAQLADRQAQLAEMQRQMAELDKTVHADKETIETKLSDLAKLAEQNRALLALRDELEKQTQDAAARAMTDEQRRAAVETQLGEEKHLGDFSAGAGCTAQPAGGRTEGTAHRGCQVAGSGEEPGSAERHTDRQSRAKTERGAGGQGGRAAALSQRILRQAA